MITIAVTGRAGSGKSLVCRFFEQLGAEGIDLDDLAREAVSPGGKPFADIVAFFGREVIDSAGGLKRKALRQTITRNPEAKRKLEEITHPEIFRLLKRQLSAIAERAPEAVVVVEVPLLVETGSQDRFDVVVLVEADEKTRKQRIAERDGCSLKEAEDLLAVQAESRESMAHADYVIPNKGSSRALKDTVKDVYTRISRKHLKSLDTPRDLS